MSNKRKFCFLCQKRLEEADYDINEDECPVIESLCQVLGLPVTDTIKLTQITNSEFCGSCQGNIRVGMVTVELIKSLELRMENIRADLQHLFMLTMTSASLEGSFLCLESSGAETEVRKYFVQCLSRCEVKIPRLHPSTLVKFKKRPVNRRRIRKNLLGFSAAITDGGVPGVKAGTENWVGEDWNNYVVEDLTKISRDSSPSSPSFVLTDEELDLQQEEEVEAELFGSAGPAVVKPKKKRGRPRKHPVKTGTEELETAATETPKRKRGRPWKRSAAVETHEPAGFIKSEIGEVNFSGGEFDEAGPEDPESQDPISDDDFRPNDVLAVELSSDSFEPPEEPRRKRGRPRKYPKAPKKPIRPRSVKPSPIKYEAEVHARNDEGFENNEKPTEMQTEAEDCTENDKGTKNAQKSTEKKKRGPKAIVVCVFCGLDFEATCRRPRDLDGNAVEETEGNSYEEFPYKCITEGCTRLFPTIKKLRVHHQLKCLQNPKSTAVPSARPTCPTCGKSFVTATWLRYHIEGVHENKFRFYCEQCGAGFQTNSELRRHIDIHHVGERNFDCDICGVKFKQKYHLVYHRQTHTKEHPYICDICGNGYPVKSKLERHVQFAHSEGENFECETCSRRFKSKVHLDHHRWYYHTEQKRGTRPRQKPPKIVPPESVAASEGLDVAGLSGEGPNPENSDEPGVSSVGHAIPLGPEFQGSAALAPSLVPVPMFPWKLPIMPTNLQPQLR